MNIAHESLQLLTPAEVADLLKISIGTLNNWRYAGRGPAWIDISDIPGGKHKRVRYAASDIAAFQQRGRIEEKSTTCENIAQETFVAGLKRQRKIRRTGN